MLWLIDSCQNRASADQYHLTVLRAQVSTYRGRVFFWWSYPLTNYQFQMIAGSSLFFPMIHIKYVVIMSLWPRSGRILISNLPRTRKFSQFFLKAQAGKTFSYHGHALFTLYVQFLYSDWSKFDRWVHAEKYAASWKLFTLTAEADRVLCQLVMFLTVFFLWMYKMKYSCYQESSVIHGWFVFWGFGWEVRRLSKFGNSISDGTVFVFHLA